MKKRSTTAAAYRSLFQRLSAPFKARLDRRYPTRLEWEAMVATIHGGLADLQRTERSLRDLRGELQGLQLTLQAALEAMDRKIADLTGQVGARRTEVDSAISNLGSEVAAARSVAEMGSAFVAHEEPHALRKKLFEAHRLARESAEAIESLLQAELMLWQAIDAANAEIDGGEAHRGAEPRT